MMSVTIAKFSDKKNTETTYRGKLCEHEKYSHNHACTNTQKHNRAIFRAQALYTCSLQCDISLTKAEDDTQGRLNPFAESGGMSP